MSSVVPPKGARDGQLMTGESLLVRLANFVKLPHTVFAMPFAPGDARTLAEVEDGRFGRASCRERVSSPV